MAAVSEVEAQCVAAFRQFDSNGDGLISRQELAQVFLALDPGNWDEARVQLLMDAADTNRDGHIHYTEFVRWLLAEGAQWETDRAALQLQRRASVQREGLVLDARQRLLRGEAWALQLDQSRGEALGLRLDGSDGKTLLITALKEGLVAQWNGQSAERQVRVGDSIVAVNDLKGDARRLMRELRKKILLDLQVAPGPGNLVCAARVADCYELEEATAERGAYGCVRRARQRESGKAYAVKSLRRRCTSAEDLERMLEILKALDHPNVMRLFAIFEDCLDWHLVTELCSGGQLLERLLQESSFTERQAAACMRQVFSGVAYLHGRQVCHRSLRPEHLLFEAEKPVQHGVLKIIDFRAARRFRPGESFQERLGPVASMPPEMASGGSHDESCDLWACGLLLYLLLSGYPPFLGESSAQTLRLVCKGEVMFDKSDWRGVSAEARSLVGSLLAFFPRERLAAAEAGGHGWIKGCQLELAPFPLFEGQARMQRYCGQNRLKKAALHEAARRLRTEEVQALHDMFGLLDRNGDKAISLQELRQGLDRLGKEESLGALTRLFEEIDLDGNRRLDYSEFLAATLECRCYHEEETLRGLFKLFDRDGSGAITRAELMQVLGSKELQELLSPEELNRVLAECDADADGAIDFSEFMALMRTEGQEALRLA